MKDIHYSNLTRIQITPQSPHFTYLIISSQRKTFQNSFVIKSFLEKFRIVVYWSSPDKTISPLSEQNRTESSAR